MTTDVPAGQDQEPRNFQTTELWDDEDMLAAVAFQKGWMQRLDAFAFGFRGVSLDLTVASAYELHQENQHLRTAHANMYDTAHM